MNSSTEIFKISSFFFVQNNVIGFIRKGKHYSSSMQINFILVCTNWSHALNILVNQLKGLELLLLMVSESTGQFVSLISIDLIDLLVAILLVDHLKSSIKCCLRQVSELEFKHSKTTSTVSYTHLTLPTKA